MTLPAIVQTPARLEFSEHELSLIKSTVLAGQQVSDVEFSVFLRAAEHLGLDPLMKQVYGIKRKGKLTIQVGIDGYRLVAARTGQFIGSGRPVYGPMIQLNKDQQVPEWAEVTVARSVNGQRAEFVGLAYWAEFYPGPDTVGAMWRQMPYKMLGKCAEAEALRKAFPADLAGTYTPDEMAQAGQDDPLRGYRDELIARARALPEGHAAQLRAWRHDRDIDPRTAEAAQLRTFDAELSNHEAAVAVEADDDVVDAVIVDDGDTSGTAVPASGADTPTPVSAPHSPLDDVTLAGEPVTPQDIAKMANYRLEQRSKKAQRGAVAEELADA